MPQNWLDGVWTGAGYQQEGYIWSIRLTANTEKNEFRIEYPSIGGSGGQWTLIEKDSTADRYTFEERIFPPDGITEDGGRIIVTKVTDNHMSFSYFHRPTFTTATAWSTLEREQK
ncbi:unnamed protein product [Rotaria socialis]|uniref:Uncharacterized protein n=1 Tax=Rotaria socialis TaxID=392032 RepID=A0A818Y1N3_9BILA|nr:unnamed protein product [Rotaria socialis]